MKEARLWVSNRNGSVFTVSASERYISELSHTIQEDIRVKRLAASDWCAWAVGHDHRVYIYVLASEVPIRVPETTYENQRWSPFSGFRSSNLVPTDGRAWSDEHGDIYLPKESIRLPSAHWDWEGDWFIDENLQGDICTDRGGWQYSVSFTGRWTSESSWNSCVRKRKWIRFCRFTATNMWATVSDMEVVEKSECFIDIAVGGQLLPGQPPDFLSVWAITNNGQVYVRTGVCRDCPEGKEWMLIPGHTMGIINIACGPTGLVWAITWDGHALVRTHVTRDDVYGIGWEMVPYPQDSTRLMQVSVGRNSVWALARDGKVWFRQGVNGDKLFWDTKAATGSGWVMMVGEMLHISVSANDQVFALGLDDEDKEIWFRTGITPSEPGGKTWQRVVLEEHPDVYDLNSPASMSYASHSTLTSPEDVFAASDFFSASGDSGMAQEDETLQVPMMKTMPATISYMKNASHSQETSHFDEIHAVQNVQTVSASNFKAGKVSPVTDCEEPRVQDTVLVSPLSERSRVQSSSWQVIENSIQTVHRSGCDRVGEGKEALETDSAPLISFVTPAASSANGLKCSLDSTVAFSNINSVPVMPLDVCNGSGDIDHTTQKQLLHTEENSFSKETSKESNAEMENRDSKNTEQTEEFGAYSVNTEAPETDTSLSGLAGTVPLSCSVCSDKFESLDSGPSSDIICNFVTDLIEDEEEECRKEKENIQKSKKNVSRNISKSEDAGKVTFQDMHDQAGDAKSFKEHPSVVPWLSIGPSETFTPRFSLNTSPSSEPEVIPAMTMTVAQPRYAWGWLAASDFMVENPSSVPWLSVSKGSESITNNNTPKISRAARNSILQLLKQRNQKEMRGFSSYEHAVEKSSWIKKAAMKILWPNKGGSWYDCTLEIEQGVTDEMDGTLTIQFKLKHRPKVLQMSLQEIRCIKMCDDHHLAVYTADPDTSIFPLTLQASSEADLREWQGTVNMANLSLWKLNCPIKAGSVCSVTVPGHIFIYGSDETRARPADMIWSQHGGHMALIETTPCGVIWALSFDRTLWVYNGGYGSALSRELSEMASNLREQVDYRTIHVFENQKWFPVLGYCSRGVFNNSFAWTTQKGKFVQSREDMKLPSSQWQWVSDWTVDFTTAGGVGNDGWQYSTKFNRPYHPKQGLRDSVRRRQWSRKCKLVTQGPWVSLGVPELIDVSLQVDIPSSPTQALVVWAIGANGDVLCRSNVTVAQPLGKSWIHIATTSDMPFRSVSVGGGYRVWAVAVDGSVWYRPGVTPQLPAGSCWIQVIPPPPGGALLQHISVGGSAVWAVDSDGNLWRREEITPTFPEGTRWTFVCNHVRSLSVGPRDQVWIVSEANFGRNKHSAGAVYRRLGITEATPSGTDWELVIGPGWHFVSIRGMMTPDK